MCCFTVIWDTINNKIKRFHKCQSQSHAECKLRQRTALNPWRLTLILLPSACQPTDCLQWVRQLKQKELKEPCRVFLPTNKASVYIHSTKLIVCILELQHLCWIHLLPPIKNAWLKQHCLNPWVHPKSFELHPSYPPFFVSVPPTKGAWRGNHAKREGKNREIHFLWGVMEWCHLIQMYQMWGLWLISCILVHRDPCSLFRAEAWARWRNGVTSGSSKEGGNIK